MKLYPILRAMGVGDKELEQKWGKDLLQKNIEAEDPRAVARAFAKLVSTRADQPGLIVNEAAPEEKAAAAEGNELSGEVQKQIISYVKSHPGLDDDDFHKFVESLGVDPHEAEEVVYKFVQEMGDGEHLFGVDPVFDRVYLEKSQYEDDLFMPPDQVWGWVEVKESPVHGNGLFARARIPEGNGITIAYKHVPDNEEHPIMRCVAVRWTNHSENPNAVLVPQDDQIWMLAKRDIEPGEEVLLNYVDSHALFDSFMKEQGIYKKAKIGARESNRKWSKLWFSGTIRAELGHDQKPWVYVEVHKGLVDSALDSLKAQGVECERSPDQPHITLLRSKDASELYKSYGPTQWKGAAKDGKPVKFALSRIVNLIPS